MRDRNGHPSQSQSRVHFLDFCEDQAAGAFTMVVFSHNLKDVGDVLRLAGCAIEIVGNRKLYDGRPDITLSRISHASLVGEP